MNHEDHNQDHNLAVNNQHQSNVLHKHKQQFQDHMNHALNNQEDIDKHVDQLDHNVHLANQLCNNIYQQYMHHVHCKLDHDNQL